MARVRGQAAARHHPAPDRDRSDGPGPARATDRYRAFLSVPGAPRLLISSIVARLPLGMASLAILLLVHQRKGSFTPAGLVVGAVTLAGAAAAPIQGTLVDRLGGRRVLAPLAICQAGAFLVLVALTRAGAPTAVLMAIGAVVGALRPPVDASVRVLWRDLVPDPSVMEAAYQLDASSQEVIWTAGPLLVALAATWSPTAAVLGTAAIVLGGTLLFVSAPLAQRSSGSGSSRRPGGALASPALRLAMIVSALIGAGVGSAEVGLPALALRAGAPGASGVLLASWSLGSMVGGFAYGLRRWRLPISSRYPILLALIAACTAPLIVAGGFAAAIPLSALAGIGFAPVLSCQYLFLANLIPRDLAAEAFMWNTASLVAGIAAGSALAGPMVQNVGVPSAFVVAAGVNALAAVLALAGRGRVKLSSGMAAASDVSP
ncbi:MAG TPA: MFS transporter [Solirubrobacteraceae bacterium]